MRSYYADRRVLVNRHGQEPGTAWFQALADPETGGTIITSQLSEVAGGSAIQRRMREGFLSSADTAHLVADFRMLCQAEYGLVGGRVRSWSAPAPC